MLEHYNRQGYKQVDWWASVSGMLFQKGGPIVTGKACARQFDYLIESEQQLPEVQEEKDQWRIVEDLVDEYEQSILESVDTRLEKAEQRLASVASVVDSLARELGVKETWE